jgi:hypothetical protein
MRKDLQKLLCEQERRGSSRSFKEVRRDKSLNEAANDDDFSAGCEGMRKRYMVRGNRKEFSENFAPLWGIIRKNVGRKWDDVYSELCEVFDMRNHVNAHILVHLWDFVERDTFIEDGEVLIQSKYGPFRTLDNAFCEYYVHPISGLLLENKKYRTYKQINRDRKEARDAESRKTCIVISKTLELRRRDEDSPWFVCTLSYLERPPATQVWDERYRFFRATYPATFKKDAWTKEYAQYDQYYCSEYRSASKKELKKYL